MFLADHGFERYPTTFLYIHHRIFRAARFEEKPKDAERKKFHQKEKQSIALVGSKSNMHAFLRFCLFFFQWYY